jgi:hypothetical protein
MSKIKNATPKNMLGSEIIPHGTGSGKYGIAIQHLYDNAGIQTNYGPGPDLPQFNTEIKSRKKSTTVPLTIASASFDSIISTNGEIFLEKLDTWNFYTLDQNLNGVTEMAVSNVDTLDWKPLHTFLKSEFTQLVNQLKNSPPKAGWILAQTKYFRIEKTGCEKNGALRVNGNKWNEIKSMIKLYPRYNNLFEEV